MSNLAKWLRNLLAHVTKETDVIRLIDDLAQVCAKQHEALRLLAPKGPEGMKLQVDAIKAAEEFQEKYE